MLQVWKPSKWTNLFLSRLFFLFICRCWRSFLRSSPSATFTSTSWSFSACSTQKRPTASPRSIGRCSVARASSLTPPRARRRQGVTQTGAREWMFETEREEEGERCRGWNEGLVEVKRHEQTSSSLTILHRTLLDSESHNPFLWALSLTGDPRGSPKEITKEGF